MNTNDIMSQIEMNKARGYSSPLPRKQPYQLNEEKEYY
jgi:hypothetical protein